MTGEDFRLWSGLPALSIVVRVLGNEFELAELPDGISVVSVVTPAPTPNDEPGHLFEVRRGTELVAQFDSLRAVADMLRNLDAVPPDQ
jgi:hypothetical protein